MWKSFSTDGLDVRNRFRLWQEVSRERRPPAESRKLGDRGFHASWQSASVGGLDLSRTSFGAHRIDSDARSIRRSSKRDTLALVMRLSGTAHCLQHDRATPHLPGDMVLFDGDAPFTIAFSDDVRSFMVVLPRERLERLLGPARNFTALPIGGASPGASLVRVFFDELARVQEALSPEMAERMASVGTDLIVAGVAERLAQDTPKPLQGTVTVQRAKAHVEAHLGDVTLDPPTLAAAVGVSLRRLQELFHERGQHIADWIWQRRLQVAAERLADPGRAHLQIGPLAYGCGFANQAHFSKRFRDRFGLSPGDYRRAALASR